MSERLTQYFTLARKFRLSDNLLVRKTILEKGMPTLLSGTGNERLRKQIQKFIQENKDAITYQSTRAARS